MIPLEPPAAEIVVVRKQQPPPPEPQSFSEAVNMIAKRDGCSRTRAMEKARADYEDLFNQYQTEGTVSSRPAERVAKKADAVRDFEKRVSEIASAEECSRVQALERARLRYPQEFDAYQSA